MRNVKKFALLYIYLHIAFLGCICTTYASHCSYVEQKIPPQFFLDTNGLRTTKAPFLDDDCLRLCTRLTTCWAREERL